MNLFKIFSSRNIVEEYKALEQLVETKKSEALQKAQDFVSFQKDVEQRSSNLKVAISKSKDSSFSDSLDFLKERYKKCWFTYLKEIGQIKVDIQKAEESKLLLQNKEEIQQYLLLSQGNLDDLHKSIDILVEGYRIGEISEESFSKGVEQIVFLDSKNPGLLTYFDTVYNIEKAEETIFQDYVDLIEKILSNPKSKKSIYGDGIVTNEKGEILFLRRNPESEFAPYVYGLPGGHVELNETPRQGMKREVEEETGCKVQNCFFVKKVEKPDAIIYYFNVGLDPEHNEITLLHDEHVNYEWVHPSKFGERSFIEGLRDVLDSIYKEENQGQDTPVVVEPEEVSDEIQKALDKPFTAEEIAKKYKIEVEEAERLLDEGEKVELEHTKDTSIARTIASHHIYKEGLGYYPALKKMEEENKKRNEKIDKYAEEYEKWNSQGGEKSGYKEPTETSVKEFLENNHEDDKDDDVLREMLLSRLGEDESESESK